MMTTRGISGSEALALGAWQAGVQFVTGYPGSPSTGTVDAMLRLLRACPERQVPGRIYVEWASNEKSAFDAAFGFSLAGLRSMVCFKSVGLNVALDSLMVSNLSAGDGGFVILVGDDPGGWGSQNEQDSRELVKAARVPLLEPTDIGDAVPMMRSAFQLSEQFHVPVVVRITRAFSQEHLPGNALSARTPSRLTPDFRRQPDRFNVLPARVVPFHTQLLATLQAVQLQFEGSPWNRSTGAASTGVIAAGHAASKVLLVLASADQPPIRILSLGTLNPVPARLISGFLAAVDPVLIMEETAPFVELEVRSVAQQAGLKNQILGRHTDHLPKTGEVFAPHISRALASILPDWNWPDSPEPVRTRPSRQPLCDGCPYIPALLSLLAAMDNYGGRDAFVVTGETGCMVRAQLPPWEILDVKYGMGSSIGLAAGLARSGIPQRVIALAGDSALLHSGLAELVDAVQAGVNLLVVVLANRTTALSGGQPHPAVGHNAQGLPRVPIDLAALIQASGPESVRVMDPEDTQATELAFKEGLASSGVNVVMVERACPVWSRT